MIVEHIMMNVAVTLREALLKARTSMGKMFVMSGKQINYTV